MHAIQVRGVVGLTTISQSDSSVSRISQQLLARLNQQIGFYRNVAFAYLIAAGLIGGAAMAGKSNMPAIPWMPFFVLTTMLFIYRYRRFWRYFGDNVIRCFRTLPPRPEPASAAVPSEGKAVAASKSQRRS